MERDVRSVSAPGSATEAKETAAQGAGGGQPIEGDREDKDGCAQALHGCRSLMPPARCARLRTASRHSSLSSSLKEGHRSRHSCM